MSIEPKEIGARIAAARARKGWTQLAFALEADVSPSSITRWESGKLPPVRELMRIADLLGVDADELVEDPPTRDDDERLDRLESTLGQVLGLVQELRDELLEARPAPPVGHAQDG